MFSLGDRRANENLHLTSMQLIWARHHNTLASSLSSINPHWDDEKLFQEARRILAAQMQHITYNEFLPVLLGLYCFLDGKVLCVTLGLRTETTKKGNM